MIFIIPFVESRPCTEQSRPVGMCPSGAESQVRKKDIKPEATNQERLMCFVWLTLFLKMTVESH